MKIRDHISLSLWPPVWMTATSDEPPPEDKREDLILREVELYTPPHLDPYRGYIRLTAEYGYEPGKTYTGLVSGRTYTKEKPGKIYTGLLTVIRDPEFHAQLYEKLQGCLGQTIREIGDAEI
jgi:hypothetical protein